VLRSSVFVAGAVVAALVGFVSGAVGAPAPPPAFPVTIVTAGGKVTIAKKPRRIVSLSPTATESLFAVGALMVAVLILRPTGLLGGRALK